MSIWSGLLELSSTTPIDCGLPHPQCGEEGLFKFRGSGLGVFTRRKLPRMELFVATRDLRVGDGVQFQNRKIINFLLPVPVAAADLDKSPVP